ncbi:MAG TPA: DUF559 domain-containing protein [Chloroflexia bacterium]|nr:DUF559 domain-containing protein [Chloroflexia bacterium]
MPARNIVVGQVVAPVKVQRSRELRQQMTGEERILWQYLRADRLAGLAFRRQQVIDGFIADFYCHAAGLIVEVDGLLHRQQADYDAERDQILAARGLRVLRIANEEVRQNLADVLARIVTACGVES